MGFSLKKIARKALGKTGSKILGTTIDALTGGTGSKLFLNGDSYLNDLSKSLTGMESYDVAKKIGLAYLTSGTGGTGGTSASSILGSIGNIISQKTAQSSAKAQAEYNAQLQYKYQSLLNGQGYDHDKEMLAMQHTYDEQMANTAVQRRKADLLAADINPIHAADTDAGGGGIGGGSGLGGGSAQSSQADWIGLRLQQLAAERDEQRVAIERSNSASSSALMSAQEQNTLAQMAETIKKLPYVGKRQEAEINNIIAGTVKSKAETAKSIADTQRTQLGRFSELGLPLGQQIQNALNPQKIEYTTDGKKKHWYGIRKDGK